MILSFAVSLRAGAATLPAGFSESLIASGLQAPTAMAFAPDGRLFVCQQGGQLRVIKNGALLPAPFTALTVNASGERGLLGVAFDPAFSTNGYVYVYYTATAPVVHNRVSRFSASGDVAVAGSEVVLLDLEPLVATNHNGGAIHFGNDGKLYIGVGENAVSANAQLLTNRLGKILRINADGTIPSDNPFFTTAAGANRAIWALGLRNPFTFAFEPVAGTLFINDVGQSAWEEIDLGVAGANYGWPVTEGATTDPHFRAPLYAYTHANGNCAISGGAFHNLTRSQFPIQYWGAYFFADLCGGWIASRRSDGTVATFATGISQPVDVQTASDGSLYYLARGAGGATGVVYRVANTPGAPTINLTANGQDTAVALAAGQSLQLAISFDAGPAGVVNPAEIYIGVTTPFGVFWLDPATGAFGPSLARLYSGPLGTAPSSTLLTIPDVSVLPAGAYWRFAIVDNDADGVPDGQFSDFAAVVIR
ncbi:MAG: PQQ-dependent sugar dehydrogenase [Acidobacteriota bacterium]